MRPTTQSPNIVQKGNEVYLQVAADDWYVYSLLEPPLGEGAMGTVYLGRSCRTGEKVAIKRVVDKYANVPNIRARAHLEASLLFRHPNLVEMIGICEQNAHTGPIFIISRLVQGITLDQHVNQHLRNRPDAVRKICESVYPVFDALEYLHSKGIYHMDIKPSNIMIENGSNIRLMDLGIAYAADVANLTSPGLIGTPKYAAPEQYVEPGQHSLPIDGTTDIYELGVTLYELLTGFNPFESSSREETLRRQRTEILPFVQGVPESVVSVLRKATAKLQPERFRTALEFKQALQQALQKPKKTAGGWKLPILIGIITGIILVIALMFFL